MNGVIGAPGALPLYNNYNFGAAPNTAQWGAQPIGGYNVQIVDPVEYDSYVQGAIMITVVGLMGYLARRWYNNADA